MASDLPDPECWRSGGCWSRIHSGAWSQRKQAITWCRGSQAPMLRFPNPACANAAGLTRGVVTGRGLPGDNTLVKKGNSGLSQLPAARPPGDAIPFRGSDDQLPGLEKQRSAQQTDTDQTINQSTHSTAGVSPVGSCGSLCHLCVGTTARSTH